ncbi:MAG: hypothetical protein AB7G48_10925 [Nitrospiraceae bacterium]
MKLNSQILMESEPEFSLQAMTAPIAFESTATGALSATVSCIAVKVDEIPINLAIPFLKRRGGMQMIASLGSFGVKVAPFSVTIEGASVRLEGILGTKGVQAEVKGKVGCKSKLNVKGKLFGKIANCAIELPDGDFEEGVEAM